jgi:hypothetical protein
MMSFIRGHEPAEHAYVKNIVKEVCYHEGWIVGEEVILPNGSRVDIVAIKNGKVNLFEVTTHQQPKGLKGNRKESLQQYGQVRLVTYDMGKSPDRNSVEEKVRNILRGE